jgi:hypothetical protein
MNAKKIFPILILLISFLSQYSHAGNVYQADWANSDKFVSIKNVGDKIMFQVCQLPERQTCETLGSPNGYSHKEIKRLQRKLRWQGIGLAGAYGALVIVGAYIGGTAGIALTPVLVPAMSVAQFFTFIGLSFVGTTGGIVATSAFAESQLNPAKKRAMATALANGKVDLYVVSIEKYLTDLESALSLLNQSETIQEPIPMIMP